jgi:serine/threonine protein kinase
MDERGKIVEIREVHALLKEVSEGLRFVHAEGFIHRDIKPDNIFIVSGVAKLGDFGLSCKTTMDSRILPGSIAQV